MPLGVPQRRFIPTLCAACLILLACFAYLRPAQSTREAVPASSNDALSFDAAPSIARQHQQHDAAADDLKDETSPVTITVPDEDGDGDVGEELPPAGWKLGYGHEEASTVKQPPKAKGDWSEDSIVGLGQQASVGAEDDDMAYRAHLEAEHSPHPGYTKHSPTLTFSNIYVLSLAHRTDRRTRMNKLARALGLRITFVDATRKDGPLVRWIAERVQEIRERKRAILSKIMGVEQEKVGGMGIGAIWLKEEVKDVKGRKKSVVLPDITTLDQRWKIQEALLLKAGGDADLKGLHGPAQVVDWVTYLESTSASSPSSLSLASDVFSNVFAELYDPLEPIPARQLNDAVLATWYSQTRVWKQMLENGDKSALVLEDDVDIEWDIERMWPNMERALPDDWEIVFLGHCWGRELAKPQYVHPFLHEANEPRCLHGYALSSAGATHLLSLLSDPWTAYQTPIDTMIPSLIRAGKLRAFSLEPAVIIQSKELSSDIQTGVGSPWRGVLADSTWDRILRDEGVDVPQLKWEDVKDDPALKARPWTSIPLGKEVAAKAAQIQDNAEKDDSLQQSEGKADHPGDAKADPGIQKQEQPKPKAKPLAAKQKEKEKGKAKEPAAGKNRQKQAADKVGKPKAIFRDPLLDKAADRPKKQDGGEALRVIEDEGW